MPEGGSTMLEGRGHDAGEPVPVRQADRLLVAGDVHGDTRWFDTLCGLARLHGCDTVLQLGDLGYWEHTADGVRFLDGADYHLASNGLQLVWVDGNHENLPLLHERYPVDPVTGLRRLRSRIHHAPRGHRWTWWGVSFLAAGGAYSVDVDWRRDAMAKGSFALWWPEEELTDRDVARCVDGGQVDVVVAHDAPWGVPLEGIDPGDHPAGNRNRERLREIVDAVRPRLLWHGHYHRRASALLTLDGGWHVQVEGFADNQRGGPDAWAVVDLDRLRAHLAATAGPDRPWPGEAIAAAAT